ncbi:hypothetical protein BEI59_22500 [Eisenbergiella tayi]|uniref:Uncharacterized protein n=1 Tax=Eisenbergiella tayi TaxID=1432052 RepID=A0A1E3UCZ8_9FIRM|nr:hypothetical protein BEI59_22500 [Eisenbergiella tayi]
MRCSGGYRENAAGQEDREARRIQREHRRHTLITDRTRKAFGSFFYVQKVEIRRGYNINKWGKIHKLKKTTYFY